MGSWLDGFELPKRILLLSTAVMRLAWSDLSMASEGKVLFEKNCMVCHDWEKRRTGPSLNQALAAYRGKPEALAQWIRSPKKKRVDYGQMPAIPLTDGERRQIADYLLERAP